MPALNLEEKARFEYLINVRANMHLLNENIMIEKGYKILGNSISPLRNGSFDEVVILDRGLDSRTIEELKNVGYKIYKLL